MIIKGLDLALQVIQAALFWDILGILMNYILYHFGHGDKPFQKKLTLKAFIAKIFMQQQMESD